MLKYLLLTTDIYKIIVFYVTSYRLEVKMKKITMGGGGTEC